MCVYRNLLVKHIAALFLYRRNLPLQSFLLFFTEWINEYINLRLRTHFYCPSRARRRTNLLCMGVCVCMFCMNNSTQGWINCENKWLAKPVLCRHMPCERILRSIVLYLDLCMVVWLYVYAHMLRPVPFSFYLVCNYCKSNKIRKYLCVFNAFEGNTIIAYNYECSTSDVNSHGFAERHLYMYVFMLKFARTHTHTHLPTQRFRRMWNYVK